jgi:hypothetical protein
MYQGHEQFCVEPIIMDCIVDTSETQRNQQIKGNGYKTTFADPVEPVISQF